MTYGSERVYKKIEVIGVAPKSVEAAIQAAVTKARVSLEGLSWFEVKEIHGHIGDNGQVDEYQVLLKAAFELK